MTNDPAARRHLSKQSDCDLTRGEYAALARVHRDTVKRWARQGIGPRPRKIGPRLVRYSRTEVLAYLRDGESQEPA
ncbi:helix-turn-helix transcriptional regulator [Streptomyces sp. NPDC008079]|uniref:helix-turn-helix transcriptional regulator n=1 Tax=Streptomyces sp. NPDC008079 TaxID=3364806 RepID=UPI0036E461C9